MINRICKVITPRVKRMRPKEITTPYSLCKQRRVSHVEEEEESGKMNSIPVEAIVSPYRRHVSITIPKNLTLDSFMFDVPEESDEEGYVWILNIRNVLCFILLNSKYYFDYSVYFVTVVVL